MRPPNSPDLNLVDHSVWGILQGKVYKTCMTDLDDLKHRIRTGWAKLDHTVIAAAVHKGPLGASSSLSVRQGRRRSHRPTFFLIVTCVCSANSVTVTFLMPMTHAPETGTENPYQKTCTSFLQVCHANRYRFFLVPKSGTE